jgi:hypothetical protein
MAKPPQPQMFGSLAVVSALQRMEEDVNKHNETGCRILWNHICRCRRSHGANMFICCEFGRIEPPRAMPECSSFDIPLSEALKEQAIAFTELIFLVLVKYAFNYMQTAMLFAWGDDPVRVRPAVRLGWARTPCIIAFCPHQSSQKLRAFRRIGT